MSNGPASSAAFCKLFQNIRSWSTAQRSAVEEFCSDPRVIAYGQKSVRELFEKISAADLVIAPDSFALHLASFYDVPAIGYFGPAHPHRFRPTGPGSASLFHQPECSPCLQLRGNKPAARGLIQCSSLAAMEPAEFIAAAEAALVARTEGKEELPKKVRV